MAPLSGLHQSSFPSDFEASQETYEPPKPPPRSMRSTWSHLPAAPQPAGSSLRAISPTCWRPETFERRPSTELSPRRRSRRRDCQSSLGGKRRGNRSWKKLLWVKQSYPDNYTDQATFLEKLQRNPRLQPYEFWPLVADSTVIVQHVCSIIIFVACFVGIFQERVSPVSVVSWGSFATFAGWCLWDLWVGKEAAADVPTSSLSRSLFRSLSASSSVSPDPSPSHSRSASPSPSPSSSRSPSGPPSVSPSPILPASPFDPDHQRTTKVAGDVAEAMPSSRHPSLAAGDSASNSTMARPEQEVPRRSPLAGGGNLAGCAARDETEAPAQAGKSSRVHVTPKQRPSSPARGGRAHLRINAMKSALLIYFTLLGLSPILKSLTRSTSSDSIWAMSLWLLAINVFFFDYSGAWVGLGNISVPSLSTNAALMASTVLASRLPSTGQVFGLTLFSIEVFGLFPVFRRYARHRSWRYHVVLTVMLILGAGGGVALTLAGPSHDGRWQWRSGLLGMVLGCLVAAVAMGGCSWWLLGLQKYKNEIYGPWDPARPIIISRRHWEDG